MTFFRIKNREEGFIVYSMTFDIFNFKIYRHFVAETVSVADAKIMKRHAISAMKSAKHLFNY